MKKKQHTFYSHFEFNVYRDQKLVASYTHTLPKISGGMNFLDAFHCKIQAEKNFLDGF